MLEPLKRKRPRLDKDVDFLRTNPEEPVREVIRPCPLKWQQWSWSTTSTGLMLRRITPLLHCQRPGATNSACIARALSTSIKLKGMVKDLRAKNVDLAQRLG